MNNKTSGRGFGIEPERTSARFVPFVPSWFNPGLHCEKSITIRKNFVDGFLTDP